MIPGVALMRSMSSGGTGAVVASTISAEPGGGRTAHVHVGDVDPGLAERRADDADHPWAVVVADHEHVGGRRHVRGVTVQRHDAGLAPPPTESPRDLVVIAANGDQVHVVDRGGAADLP